MTALALVSEPSAHLDGNVSAAVSMLAVPGFVLLGGLWVTFIGWVMLRDLPNTRIVPPSRAAIRRFALTLSVLIGVGTFVAMTWIPGGSSWWVLLTIFVIVQPDTQKTRQRLYFRVLGTVLGGAAAAVLVILIDENTIITAIGVVLAMVSGGVYLKAPYWVFACTLTAAVIFLNFTPSTALYGDAERIVFTLVGAAGVFLISAISDRFISVPPDGPVPKEAK